MSDSIDLGSVITVLDNRPAIFTVRCIELEPSTSDPFRRIPYVYKFDISEEIGQYIGISRFVKVTDEMVRFVFGKVMTRMHNEAIKYGLYSMRENPGQNEFLFTTEEHKRLASIPKLSGPELRKEVLRFFNTVYIYLPQHGIGLPDLADNFFNSEDELLDRVKQMMEADLLIKIRGFREFRLNRGHVKSFSYRINAKKAHDVEAELGLADTGGGLTPPGDLYELYKVVPIEAEWEPNGFIFYMTPFEDEWLELFEREIRPFCQGEFNLPIVVSKDDHQPNSLTDKIISHIHKCKFAIAEITTKNPNVLYELGFAHAINRKVIIICRKDGEPRKPIFDVRDVNTIYYPDLAYLKAELKLKIDAVLKALGR